jgi:hypothetical protein
MQQFFAVRQQLSEEQVLQFEGCFATACFGLAWGQKDFHVNLLRWYAVL